MPKKLLVCCCTNIDMSLYTVELPSNVGSEWKKRLLSIDEIAPRNYYSKLWEYSREYSSKKCYWWVDCLPYYITLMHAATKKYSASVNEASSSFLVRFLKSSIPNKLLRKVFKSSNFFSEMVFLLHRRYCTGIKNTPPFALHLFY